VPAIRGLTVCVGPVYAELLRITLPRNVRHFSECWVATTPDDEATAEVVAGVPGARLFTTTGFRDHGAFMNKGLGIERCFDAMGRHGWFCVHDSDCVFPPTLPLDDLNPEALHGCRRRVLADPAAWHPGLDWSTCPVHEDSPGIGYCQLFHSDAAKLNGVRPWYNVNFPHAGGCDAQFLDHWVRHGGKVVTLPAEVLHLGQPDMNWWGCSPEARDRMSAYVHRMGWRAAMARHDPTAVERVGELAARVDVPGYETSDYQMYAERRARSWRPQPPR
jgi:hypothetical protein